MSEVKIYTLVMGEKEILGFKHGDEQRIGEFVKYKDYAELEAKCAALAAENAMLKQRTQQLIDIISNTDNDYCMCGSAMKDHVHSGCGILLACSIIATTSGWSQITKPQ